MGGDEEFYINYFQEPGRAEAEVELDVRAWLVGFYVGASGDALPPPDGGTMATVRRGGQLRDRFVIPDQLPAWLTEEDLDFYAAEFEGKGFRGALNRYRNVDRDWVDLQPWRGSPSPCRRSLSAASVTGRPCGAGHRPLRPDAARPAGQPHPPRLRTLGAAGAGPRGQRAAGRVARRPLTTTPSV